MTTEEKNTTLATIPNGMEGMMTTERPGGEDKGELGNEGIGREDIVMPRVGLAQLTSKELISTDERFIAGLAFMDMFHSLTRKPYGRGPLYFSILRRYDPRYIEFFPLDQGGGIKEFDVPADDPRTKFTTIDGKRVKPAATMFYDFIVLLLNDLDTSDPMSNVIALSFKSSGLQAAKHLNFLVQERGKKLICRGVYEVRTDSKVDKKSGGTYAVYKVKNAGWLKDGSEVEKLAVQMFESWKDRAAPKVDVDKNPLDDDQVPVDDSMSANPENATEM